MYASGVHPSSSCSLKNSFWPVLSVRSLRFVSTRRRAQNAPLEFANHSFHLSSARLSYCFKPLFIAFLLSMITARRCSHYSLIYDNSLSSRHHLRTTRRPRPARIFSYFHISIFLSRANASNPPFSCLRLLVRTARAMIY